MGFREVFDYGSGKADWLAAGLPTEGRASAVPRAGMVARSDVPRCHLEERLGDVRDRVEAAHWDACVVVDDAGVVLGLLRRDELAGEADRPIEEAMRPGPSTFRPNVHIVDLAGHMVEHELESAPITTGDGVLVGLLRREDAVNAAREFQRRHTEDHEEHPA
ncbi:MAG TPA: CBS domain-containing protein [Actinomycetota bacterium]|nr:CBS domain-containing protein [Actinomycetota bacterium]